MKRLLVFGLYGVLVATIVGVASYLALSFVVQRGPKVAVPGVEGLGLSQALDALDSRKLDLEIGRFEFSDRVPENHVVRQRPAPGRVIKAGRPVRVILSRGAEKHPVPDVAGVSLDDARIQLGEAGLLAQVAGRMQAGPAGQIVAQGVEPGTRLRKGTTVALVISSGPKPIRLRMPSVEGIPLEKAIVALDEAGLRVEHVEETRGAPAEKRGTVLSQEPLPGAPVLKGGGVTLAVGGGEETEKK